jgi:hypothetical protein
VDHFLVYEYVSRGSTHVTSRSSLVPERLANGRETDPKGDSGNGSILTWKSWRRLAIYKLAAAPAGRGERERFGVPQEGPGVQEREMRMQLIIGDGSEELVSQTAGDVHMYDWTWTRLG